MDRFSPEPASRPAHDAPAPPALDLDAIAEIFGTLALAAGEKIMRIYASHANNARLKADNSPVCDADVAAEAILLAGLAAHLPNVTVVSEEAYSGGERPETGSMFVLVDPLDGTREFLAANGEFTVNLALIVDGKPVAGAVYAPAISRLWLGGAAASCCSVAPGAPLPDKSARTPIHVRAAPKDGLVAFMSRSHPDAKSEEFLARINVTSRRCAGSSLKFCLLAEGEGDVYPRCGPTMQWDVAAGDAVLRAAGGSVVDARGAPFHYGLGPDGFRNGPFVAWGGASPETVRTLLP